MYWTTSTEALALEGGRLINNLRYTDDMVLIKSSEQDLQELLDRVYKVKSGSCSGLAINAAKTEVMTLTNYRCRIDMKVNGERIEQIQSFVYLGSTFQETGDGYQETTGYGEKCDAICEEHLEVTQHINTN